MAAFVYNTAMRDEKLPRKPETPPSPTPAVAAAPPATAVIETTLGTASGQIRQFAFDGDPGTFYASERSPASDDHFTLVLDRPVTLKSVAAISGRADGADRLEAGSLEVSSDGSTFSRYGEFVEGEARGADESREVRAVRIRPEPGQSTPWCSARSRSNRSRRCRRSPIRWNSSSTSPTPPT